MSALRFTAVKFRRTDASSHNVPIAMDSLTFLNERRSVFAKMRVLHRQ